MVSTPSTRLGFEMQGQNDNTGSWWNNANQVFQGIDDALAKEVVVATTGGDTALSVNSYAADESRCPIIRIGPTQTLLSNVRITTARARVYFVTNETAAGSFTVGFGGNTSNQLTIPRGSGAYVRVRSDSTTTFAGPLIVLATGAIDATSLAGGLLLSSSNLSDLANASTARTNLGLAIGSNVQAYDADLTTWASISPSANVQTFVSAANFAAMRSALGVAIGSDVQAYDADLATWAGLAPSANAQSLVTAADYAAMRILLSLVYASAAEQITGSDTAKVVAPATQHKHQSAIKAHCRFVANGTLQAGSYGVASVVKNGTGNYTVTLSTAMANGNGTPHASADRALCSAAFGSTTQISVLVYNTSGVGADPGSVGVSLYVMGDQ